MDRQVIDNNSFNILKQVQNDMSISLILGGLWFQLQCNFYDLIYPQGTYSIFFAIIS